MPYANAVVITLHVLSRDALEKHVIILRSPNANAVPEGALGKCILYAVGFGNPGISIATFMFTACGHHPSHWGKTASLKAKHERMGPQENAYN